MKKSFLLLLCLILVALTALVACDGHEHTYSDVWSTDETNHWHKATCEHTDATAALGAHVDADKNLVCDICAYDYNHTHAYATEWSTDDNYHWHVASCGCEYVSDKGAHIDTQNDGVCDVCSLGSDHEHTIADVWTFDETNHWYAATCGHSIKESEAAHTLDKAGVCTVCSYGADKLTVEGAIELAIQNAGLVNKGQISDLADYGTGRISATVNEFEFGKNLFYYLEMSKYSQTEYWYTLVGEDGAFGAYGTGEEVYPAYEPTPDNVKGFAFNVIGYNFYGAEDLVAGLYEFALENANGDAEVYMTTVDGELVYTFTFGYFVEDNGFYQVTVAFTLSDEYAINSLTVIEDAYTYVYDDYAESEEEAYLYGYEKNEDGTYTATWLNPGTTYMYVVSQEEGERTLENKYDPAKVIVSGFDLLAEDESVLPATGNTAVAGVLNSYVIGAITPETALSSLNEVQYTVLLNGEEAMEYVDYMVLAWGDSFDINFYKAGTYAVTVNYGTATKTYEFAVTVADATELAVSSDGEVITEATVYVGVPLQFTVSDAINPYANCEYTVSCVSEAATITSEGGVNTFTATAAGTYIVAINAKNNVSTAIVITVEEAPSVAEILSGEYVYSFCGTTLLSVVFTPSAEGATTGTVVLTSEELDKVGTFNYTYDEDTGAIVLTDVEDAEIVHSDWLAVVDYQLVVESFGDYAVLTRPAEAITADFFVDKTYTNGQWYIFFTTYDGIVYTAEIKDVVMGRPMNAQGYTYTVSEGFMVWNINLTENGEAHGEPLYVIEMFYDEETDTVVVITENYQEIEFSLYNPFGR